MVGKASVAVLKKARNFLARDGPGSFDQPDVKSSYNALRTAKKSFRSGLSRCLEYRLFFCKMEKSLQNVAEKVVRYSPF